MPIDIPIPDAVRDVLRQAQEEDAAAAMRVWREAGKAEAMSKDTIDKIATEKISLPARGRIRIRSLPVPAGQRVKGQDVRVEVVTAKGEVVMLDQIMSATWRVDARGSYAVATLYASGVEIDAEAELSPRLVQMAAQCAAQDKTIQELKQTIDYLKESKREMGEASSVGELGTVCDVPAAGHDSPPIDGCLELRTGDTGARRLARRSFVRAMARVYTLPAEWEKVEECLAGLLGAADRMEMESRETDRDLVFRLVFAMSNATTKRLAWNVVRRHRKTARTVQHWRAVEWAPDCPDEEVRRRVEVFVRRTLEDLGRLDELSPQYAGDVLPLYVDDEKLLVTRSRESVEKANKHFEEQEAEKAKEGKFAAAARRGMQRAADPDAPVHVTVPITPWSNFNVSDLVLTLAGEGKPVAGIQRSVGVTHAWANVQEGMIRLFMRADELQKKGQLWPTGEGEWGAPFRLMMRMPYFGPVDRLMEGPPRESPGWLSWLMLAPDPKGGGMREYAGCIEWPRGCFGRDLRCRVLAFLDRARHALKLHEAGKLDPLIPGTTLVPYDVDEDVGRMVASAHRDDGGIGYNNL